jgi:hypothetical protein
VGAEKRAKKELVQSKNVSHSLLVRHTYQNPLELGLTHDLLSVTPQRGRPVVATEDPIREPQAASASGAMSLHVVWDDDAPTMVAGELPSRRSSGRSESPEAYYRSYTR